jgi:DNA invertase Pin-like site-specific DNA recombinase
MVSNQRKKLRCAIYTRKSTEEGLEQEFNSLDAQREACVAYIASQKHEGWICVADQYDDGGISGATLDRPAMQKLLADIKAQKIDVVVVYKVDRLTRALADFAKIVEIFDAHEVSFVSVTQQFNTTTSMGRLTLNVLLSFAQFEREVTAERIRDKIAASKKRGMWMGGNVPLGYDAKDRTLVINEGEAETVRTLSRLYLELGSVRDLQAEAQRRGLRSKTGRSFSYGHLYFLLQNPIYIGLIRHKKATYPGLHPPIIDQATWDTVQQQLSEHRVARHNGARRKNPSPLAGKLFDDKGVPFTPTHAVKKGRRYRYYIERRDADGDGDKRSKVKRISADEIESLVVGALIHQLHNSVILIEVTGASNLDAAKTKSLLKHASDLARKIKCKDGQDHHPIVRTLIGKVIIGEQQVRMMISGSGLQSLLGMEETERTLGDHHYEVVIPARLRPRGVELKLVVLDPSHRPEPKPDPVLIKALIKANNWLDRLLTDKRCTISKIANAEGVTGQYIRRLLELAFLAPDITEAILDGRQPADISAEWLVRHADLPLGWREQRQALGLTL